MLSSPTLPLIALVVALGNSTIPGIAQAGTRDEFGDSKPATSSTIITEAVVVLLSGTPSNLLAAHSAYAPHFAQLTLRGRFHEFPAIEFTATASLNTIAGGSHWEVSALTASAPLPPGVALPLIGAHSVEDGFGQLPTQYVWLQTTDGSTRASTWTIDGEASSEVGVVLLPRYRMLPWRGSKQVDVLKIRYGDPAPPANQPPLSVYQDLFSQLQNSFSSMSNGQVNFDIHLVDHLTTIPNQLITANCGTFFSQLGGNDYTFRKRVIQEKLAIDPGWRRDAVFYTYDYSLSHGLTCEYFRSPHGAGQPPTADCPQCGPGGEIKVGTWLPGEWGFTLSSAFGHELAHGLGAHDRYYNPINYCTDGNPLNVKPGHLFYRASTCLQEYGGLQDDSMGASGVRDGVRYDLVERASLGWLKPSNVKTVLGTGVYDLYQENDDLTVPEGLPVILQVPVQFGGIQDYVYLTTINLNVFNRYVGYPNPAVAQHQSQGVVLSAGVGGNASNPLQFRYGLSRHAANLSHYSYSNNQIGLGTFYSAIPVGTSVRLNEMGDPVSITVLSKQGNQVRVQVSYESMPAPPVRIGGRVLTPTGQGLRNATVRLQLEGQAPRTVTTSSFGYFLFENISSGLSATIGVSSKRYRFTPLQRTFTSDVEDLEFVGLE